MQSNATFRSMLNEYMKQKGINLHQFANKVGLNVGSLSYILNGHRKVTIEQLDMITEGLGENKGLFYDQYFKEVLVEATPNWRRIKPFLLACEEAGRLDLIQKSVELLLDNLMYSQVLFEMAENFFRNGQKEAARIIYENVALSEKNQHSERLALCQYRLFTCRLGINQEKNYQTAIQYEMFVDRLDGFNHLEALKDLANTYRSLRHWDKVEEIALKLKEKAEFYYQLKKPFDLEQEPVRPLFTYIAYSDLLLGSVYEARGDYLKALDFIDLYSSLNWVKEEDESSLLWKNKFHVWAKVNKMATRIAAGDSTLFTEYLSYMESNAEELLLAFLNVVSAANRYSINIDEIIRRMDIGQLVNIGSEENTYTRQIIEERLARFYYELSYYYLNIHEYKGGFEYLIRSLEKSVSINLKSRILNCVGLFEKFRDKSDVVTLSAYKNIIEGVCGNENKTGDSLNF